MSKFKVFISSVQAEFAHERQRIYDYIRDDELMSQYFDPFIFERIASQDANPKQLYLEEAAGSQVYLLLIGQQYGNAQPGKPSPTEQEYQAAAESTAYRIAYIKDLDDMARDEREELFFRKVQSELSYRTFANSSVLVSLVKQSLITFLKYKGIIHEQTLDEQVRSDASLEVIDAEKVREFIRKARSKRAFPLPEDTEPDKLLRHLRMLRDEKPTNAALLLFAKDPQYFFPTAVVKCAWFLTNEVVKPIEDYKTFEGDVLDQITQATSWTMSKLSLRYGVRDLSPQNEAELEIPRSVIFETIVNAVAHRDYNSTGSVQVSVFPNRIVVRNPGTLPVELTKADLMKEHGSYPHNPFLAEALFQAGFIDKYGTGITENIRKMQEAHLLAPDIDLSAEFVTTIWRNVATSTANDATSPANVATNIATSINNIATSASNIATSVNNIATTHDYTAQNKKIIDSIVKPKIKPRMKKEQIIDCIIKACIVEHTIDELADLLNKTSAYLRNFIIPDLVAEGILLPTKPRHSPGQSYFTNPKYSI